jgi:hypothetical protein
LRGALRYLASLGHAALAEFPLRSGRRADILALDANGRVWIVEVKSGIADFRSDSKWRDYLEWCDRFFFAVDTEFPLNVLPSTAGILIADSHDGVLARDAEEQVLSAARRKALTLRFAHLAANRLAAQEDPFRAKLPLSQ